MEAQEAANRAEEEALNRRHQPDGDVASVIKSPSDFSCVSYEMVVGQGQDRTNDENNREKMSIKSEGGESITENKQRTNGKFRKVSFSYSFIF